MRLFKKLALILLIIFCDYSANASHGLGGELTWNCLGSGQYQFHIKFYRDCNGITPGNVLSMATTVPSIPLITLPLVAQNDISAAGFYNNGITQCANCLSGGGGPAIFGIVKEYIYESIPVTLTGVPPVSGWVFSWGECCRSSSIANLSGSGSAGMFIKAKMYSYNGQNADPCFDSSPVFAEKPSVMQCSGIPVNYQHLTFDADYDSLSYAFSNPLDDMGNPIPFAPGYSVTNPLPGNAILNSLNGQISYIPTLGGAFVLPITVSSFKCGILVSEITREIEMIINNNCPNVKDTNLVSVMNTAPHMLAPFIDSTTGLYTSFNDTVFAGDSVLFVSYFYDYDLFNNGSAQEVTINTFSNQYGLNYNDPNNGCLIPPCATLGNPVPYTLPIFSYQDFHWQTTTAHLGISFSCVNFSNTYYFNWIAQDNYCPANAVNSNIISITVLPLTPQPPLINNNGILECGLTGNYIYQWFLNRFAIPGATGVTYTPLQSGTYHVLAVAQNGDGNYSTPYYYNPLGINEIIQLADINIYPNPSSKDFVNVEFSSLLQQPVSFIFYNAIGQRLYLLEKNIHSGKNQLELNTSLLSSGVFMIEIQANNFTSRKVIVKM